jgi:hypothetical protein
VKSDLRRWAILITPAIAAAVVALVTS